MVSFWSYEFRYLTLSKYLPAIRLSSILFPFPRIPKCPLVTRKSRISQFQERNGKGEELIILPLLIFHCAVVAIHLGKEALSLSRYSPRAFWILPSRSARRSRLFWTPGMFKTSITRGDLVTFFISARNSELMLLSVQKYENRNITEPLLQGRQKFKSSKWVGWG